MVIDSKESIEEPQILVIEAEEDFGEEFQEMVGLVRKSLLAKLNPSALKRIERTTVKVGPGLVEGGGEARAEEDLVLLNSDKVRMTLQQSEDLLVQEGYFESGQRTKLLTDIKDKPWSTLVYELIHEVGHIIGGEIPTHLSPTKYGKRAPHEAFAEAYTYWVFDHEIDPEAEKTLAGFAK